MRGDDWKIQVEEKADGTVSRLGVGHAWVWTRATGETHTFNCGAEISHVLDGIANRLNIHPRAVVAVQA